MNRLAVTMVALAVLLLLALLIVAPLVTPQQSSAPSGLSRITRKMEARLNTLAQKLEREDAARRAALLQQAFKSGEAVRIRIPYRNPGSGEWRNMEAAIAQFARSNRMEIIQLETVGMTNAYVCVWAKDASAMRAFAASLRGAPEEKR